MTVINLTKKRDWHEREGANVARTIKHGYDYICLVLIRDDPGANCITGIRGEFTLDELRQIERDVQMNQYDIAGQSRQLAHSDWQTATVICRATWHNAEPMPSYYELRLVEVVEVQS